MVNIEERSREAEKGEYDWVKMFEEIHSPKFDLSSSPSPAFSRSGRRGCGGGGSGLDVADYTHPSLKIISIPDKGRCLITTQSIRIGELLLVSKALVTASPKEVPDLEVVSINFDTKLIDNTLHVVALGKMIHQLIDEPGLGRVVGGLYPTAALMEKVERVGEEKVGKGKGKGKGGILRDPVVSESERLEILERQCEGLDGGNKGKWANGEGEEGEEEVIDVEWLEGILTGNKFGVKVLSEVACDSGIGGCGDAGGDSEGEGASGTDGKSEGRDDGKGQDDEGTTTMLFGLPSLINHSCLPNISIDYWGDVSSSRFPFSPSFSLFSLFFFCFGFGLLYHLGLFRSPVHPQDLSSRSPFSSFRSRFTSNSPWLPLAKALRPCPSGLLPLSFLVSKDTETPTYSPLIYIPISSLLYCTSSSSSPAFSLSSLPMSILYFTSFSISYPCIHKRSLRSFIKLTHKPSLPRSLDI